MKMWFKFPARATPFKVGCELEVWCLMTSLQEGTKAPGGGGGGTPLYKLYRYVLPQRAWFLSRFGLKTGIDFDHYGLKSGMVYKGTMGQSVYTYLSFQLQMNGREREVSKIYHSS